MIGKHILTWQNENYWYCYLKYLNKNIPLAERAEGNYALLKGINRQKKIMIVLKFFWFSWMFEINII